MKRLAFFLTIASMALTMIAQDLMVQHLGVVDGLCNDYIRGLVQDKRGFIWIATEGGLSRFDGYNFTNYNSRPTGENHLTADGLNHILYDCKEDRLWIGGKFEGVDVMDCSTYRIENIGQEDSIAHVMNIGHSRDSLGIWLTPYYGDLIYYDKKDKKFVHYDISLPNNKESGRRCVADDGHGNVYIGYIYQGLGILNTATGEKVNLMHDPDNPRSLPSDYVMSLYVDSLDNLWVGTSEGLALYNPITKDFTVFRHSAEDTSLIGNVVLDIQEMKDGTLWVATDVGGISILDIRTLALNSPENIAFTHILPLGVPFGLSSPTLQCLLQDRAGNIWIGSVNRGIDIIPHTQAAFKQFPYYESKNFFMQHKPVWAIWCDSDDGSLWIGGENEMVAYRDSVTQYYSLIPKLRNGSSHVLSIAPDGPDYLLLGLNVDGLLRLDKRTGALQRIEGIKPFGNVSVMYVDPLHDWIWVGSDDEMYKYKDGKLELDTLITSMVNQRQIMAITRDNQGRLWVGTRGRGISIFGPDGQVAFYLNRDKETLPNNEINGLLKDSRGEMWAASRFGLIHFPDTNDPSKYEVLEYDDGLDDICIRNVGEDANGNIWITNNNHVAKWNAENRAFEVYGISDGLPQGNFVENSWCRDNSGTMYFGSLGGACFFYPEYTQCHESLAPVVISDCEAIDRNSFRISFAVVDYAQCSRVGYEYYLEGVSKHWTDTQGDNQITFRNLPHGKYRLKVRASFHNQPWTTTEPAEIVLTVKPPFWLTWWMKLIYLIIIAVVAYFGLKIYRGRLELKSHLEMERQKNIDVQMLNDERLRFFTNITHELRTPLTLILGPLEDLTSDVELPVQYQARVKAIHDSAQRLYTLVNQILEFRKTETQNRKLYLKSGSLQRLVMETGLHYQELNRNKKVKFVLDIDKTLPPMLYDAHIVDTVLANFLSNAVKYTPEGEIRLTLRKQEIDGQPWAVISVQDTGYGIDSNALPHIFERYYQAKGTHQASGTGIGLALVKGLADVHGAILNVESTLGKGSTFSFAIKIEPAKLDETEDAGKEAEGEGPTEEETAAQALPLVLVAEDNDDIRDYIAQSLSPHFRVITAADGQQGLDLARKNIPDIVVTDIMMPVMDGIEFCSLLKSDVKTSHIPVVMLTAKDTMMDKEKGYESGADSYMTKPFTARLLIMRLNNLLAQRQRIAEYVQHHNVEEMMSPSSAQEEEPKKTEEAPQLSRLDIEFLEKFRKIVEDNISNPALDMTTIREKMYMSHSTLYRKLKALTGLSGNEYIRKLRLAYAVKLLLAKESNVSEAAYASGFNDPAYFRACFKREYGMTPTEYINSIQSQHK